MKKLFFFITITFCFTAAAQRTNDNDDLRVSYTAADNAQNVYFTINKKWFSVVDTQPIMYVAENDIVILSVNISTHNYDEVLNRLKQDEHIKVVIQEEKKRLKCTNELPKSTLQTVILSYGVFLTDGTMLSLLIQLPKGKTAEWEPYFDNVAKTLSLKP